MDREDSSTVAMGDKFLIRIVATKQLKNILNKYILRRDKKGKEK
jgi:hypothetical protein